MSETLQELVDIQEFQDLMGFFYEAVGVPLGVQDNHRNWLVDFGFQSICSDFHRLHPASREVCRENTREVFRRLGSADYVSMTCQHGLEVVAFPIVLNQSRLGMFYLGQFLHAPADLEFFQRQASEYGYDEAAYLKALEAVPVVSQERIDFLMQFFMRFLRLLIRLGDENQHRKHAEQAALEANRQLEAKVEERTQELNNALNEVGDLVVQSNSLLRHVEQMAVTDSLTDTYNRRKFDEVAVIEHQQVMRGKLPFSLIMFDIDRFKQVNDQYGHSVGDQVLKQLCDIVRKLIRQGDMLIRWGGEEFLIVLPATQVDEAGPLAERIRHVVKAEAFPGVGQITISLGVAQLRRKDSIDSLIQRVDQALYSAKQKGRDCVVLEA